MKEEFRVLMHIDWNFVAAFEASSTVFVVVSSLLLNLYRKPNLPIVDPPVYDNEGFHY
jgi:hypothetical protein